MQLDVTFCRMQRATVSTTFLKVSVISVTLTIPSANNIISDVTLFKFGHDGEVAVDPFETLHILRRVIVPNLIAFYSSKSKYYARVHYAASPTMWLFGCRPFVCWVWSAAAANLRFPVAIYLPQLFTLCQALLAAPFCVYGLLKIKSFGPSSLRYRHRKSDPQTDTRRRTNGSDRIIHSVIGIKTLQYFIVRHAQTSCITRETYVTLSANRLFARTQQQLLKISKVQDGGQTTF